MSLSFKSLVLLSSYRLASKYRQSPGEQEASAFLHGYLALWHPALIRASESPPVVASPYDHEQPSEETLYSLPHVPFHYLPDDWKQRLETARSLSIDADPDWDLTLHECKKLVGSNDDSDLSMFLGLGLGFLTLDAFCDAMDHSNPLDIHAFWSELRQATEQGNTDRPGLLQSAAQRLKEAREVVYPSTMYQIWLGLLEGVSADKSLKEWFSLSLIRNWIGSASWLKNYVEKQTDAVASLKSALSEYQAEWIGGPEVDQEDGILPVEEAIKNLKQGLVQLQKSLDQPILVHGRKRFASSPLWPHLLKACGMSRTYASSFDSGGMPHFPSIVTEWSSPDGEMVTAFQRKPEPWEEAQTAFHLAYLLHQTSSQDFCPTLCIGSNRFPEKVPIWIKAWSALHELAPVFGQPTSLSHYLSEVSPGERPEPPSVDDFQSDYLLDLTGQAAEGLKVTNPISRFAITFRQYYQKQAITTLGGMLLGLCGKRIKDKLSVKEAESAEPVKNILADRIVSPKLPSRKGYLLFNSTSHSRVVCVRLPGVKTPLPAPSLATQIESDGSWVAVEMPGCGFAWLPGEIDAGTLIRKPKMGMVDGFTLKNQHLSVEVDPNTGGIRVIRDAKTETGRLGQQLIFHPGSKMVAHSCEVTKRGPCFAEITSQGELQTSHAEPLATFEQKIRLVWGHPYCSLHVTLKPTQVVSGYPWHAYYGSRFAWRDPHAILHRGVGWMRGMTSQTRPESPLFHEVETGGLRTAILTGGLPFAQRFGQRMLDILLQVEGETATEFELAIAIDPTDPLLTTQEWLSPVTIVPVEYGPPTSGPTGWLFQLDRPDILLSEIRVDPESEDAVLVRLMETRGVQTLLRLSAPRNISRSETLDEFGNILETNRVEGDSSDIAFLPFQMRLVRVSFA